MWTVPPVEESFVSSIICLIECLCSIENLETNHPPGFDYDLEFLYRKRSTLLQDARDGLSYISEDQKAYAIGRGRQKVYDCEYINICDQELTDLLGITLM